MSIPILTNGTARVWLCDRDPMSTEPDANIELVNFWFNDADKTLFVCLDADDPDDLIWKQVTLT